MQVSQPWLSCSRRRSCPRELMETGERPEEPGGKVSFKQTVVEKLIKNQEITQEQKSSGKHLQPEKHGPGPCRLCLNHTHLTSPHPLKSQMSAPAYTPFSPPPCNLDHVSQFMSFFNHQVDFSLSSSMSLKMHGLQATVHGVAKSQTCLR